MLIPCTSPPPHGCMGRGPKNFFSPDSHNFCQNVCFRFVLPSMHRLDHCMCSCNPPAPCTSLQVYKTSIITSGGGVPIHHRLCLHPPLPRGCAEVLPRGASQGARCVYTNCIETVTGAWVTGQNNFWRHGLQNFVQWSPLASTQRTPGSLFEGSPWRLSGR